MQPPSLQAPTTSLGTIPKTATDSGVVAVTNSAPTHTHPLTFTVNLLPPKNKTSSQSESTEKSLLAVLIH